MQHPHIVAIIQGRMSSSRLPGKVMRDIGGQPMLKRVIDRVRRARLVDSIIVATTIDSSDDPIADFCQSEGVAVFRGSLFDVLDRYYQAAVSCGADVIVRVTADCPMIDPMEIDRVIQQYLVGDCDFATNRLPPPYQRTSPLGMDTEVCSFSALENAWHNASEKFEHEHVMPYLYDEPGRFRIQVVEMEPSLGHMRFTVDTDADLQVARAIYASFNNRDDFSLADLLEHSSRNPQWQYSLAGIQHKTFRDVDERSSQPLESDSSELTAPLDSPSMVKGSLLPHCLLCGSARVKPFETIKSFDVSVNYFLCQQCGFVFQDPHSSQSTSPEFYVEQYRKIYQDTSDPTSKDLRQQVLRSESQIEFLKSQRISSLERILDIGASSGILLQGFQTSYNATCFGVEPGRSYRELAKSKGLPMFDSVESLLASHPKPFSLVSLMHVLEHLENPVGTLTRIREHLLDPQGWLLLEVPNFYCHDSYELAHISCFTSHTLVEMLHKSGYEVVTMRVHGHPRSAILKLYINVLARPCGNPSGTYHVRPEKNVIVKRHLGLLWRDLQTKLVPGRAWSPVEDR